MELLSRVRFEDDEREVFRRALAGHEFSLIDPPRSKKEEQYRPVGVFLHRIVDHNEAFELADLHALAEVFDRLIAEWRPETKPETWRAYGATGSDLAIEGLANERRNAINRVIDAAEIVGEAIDALASDRAVISDRIDA